MLGAGLGGEFGLHAGLALAMLFTARDDRHRGPKSRFSRLWRLVSKSWVGATRRSATLALWRRLWARETSKRRRTVFHALHCLMFAVGAGGQRESGQTAVR